METGAIGDFDDADALVRAARELRRRGYRNPDAFTPQPVHGRAEVRGLPRPVCGWGVLPLALLGAVTGYVIQWFCNALDYPLNVGARPLHSAPAWIPITFETMVLFASLSGLVIALWLMGLPRLYRPLFDLPEFHRATVDRFFVGVDAADPSYSAVQAERDLLDVGAKRVVFAR